MNQLRRRVVAGMGGAIGIYLTGVRAQQPGKLARIGFFHYSPRADLKQFQAFIEGLRTLGHIEGKNLAIEYLQGEISRYPELAQELVRGRVDVIFAPTPQAVLAARKTTQSVPIVFAVVGDPIEAGYAESLRRPGGNVTGLTAFGNELIGKRLEILKEINPRMTRIAVVWNPTVPDKVIEMKNGAHAAQALKVQLQSLEVKSPGDFDGAFETARRGRAEAVILLGEPLASANRGRVIRFASAARIPAIFNWQEAAAEGGLISFGPNIADNYRQAATYVDKILKGAKPGDLPIEQPTKFDLVVNLKTAKALGITMPQSILVRATKVIE